MLKNKLKHLPPFDYLNEVSLSCHGKSRNYVCYLLEGKKSNFSDRSNTIHRLIEHQKGVKYTI